MAIRDVDGLIVLVNILRTDHNNCQVYMIRNTKSGKLFTSFHPVCTDGKLIKRKSAFYITLCTACNTFVSVILVV